MAAADQKGVATLRVPLYQLKKLYQTQVNTSTGLQLQIGVHEQLHAAWWASFLTAVGLDVLSVARASLPAMGLQIAQNWSNPYGLLY